MFDFPQLKKKWLKKVIGIWLINQVRSRRVPYTLQITEETSFFFHLPYLEHDFMITNLVRVV